MKKKILPSVFAALALTLTACSGGGGNAPASAPGFMGGVSNVTVSASHSQETYSTVIGNSEVAPPASQTAASGAASSSAPATSSEPAA